MKNNLPNIIEWILRFFIREDDIEHRLGDFEEMYQYIYKKDGKLKATKWYLKQLITSIPKLLLNSFYWGVAMFKNYLLVAFRNFKNQKVFSILNITGLALGLACTLLILLWVQDELGYDKFHNNGDETYRLILEKSTSEVFRVPVTPAPLGPFLKENYPEIEQITRCSSAPRTLKYGENFKKTYNNRGLFADPNFFEVFNFPLKRGDISEALRNKNSIVISEELAKVCFGKEYPLGKTLLFNNNIELLITGVISKQAGNSHLDFNFVVPIELARQFRYDPNDWTSDILRTYVILKPGTEKSAINKKIENVIVDHVPNKNAKIIFQPLDEIHLYSLDGGGQIVYVYILSAIGLFILVIACINFMNLSTAHSINRSKEIGLRKVIGAQREGLIKQFLSESLLASFLSLFLALIIVITILPYYNYLTQKEFLISSVINTNTLFVILIITLITGLLSGSYPAIYLSSFNPLNIMSNRGITGDANGNRLRRILVVVQFSLSIFLIIGSIVVHNQLEYIKNKDLGLDKENLVYMQLGTEGKNSFQSIKNELKQNTAILNVTRTNSPLLYLGFETSNVSWEGQKPEEKINVQIRSVDYDYLETFRMKLTEGRFFSSKFGSDSLSFVLNQKAIKTMEMESPVGKSFSFSGFNGKIIGVVKDFHHHSLNTEIEPLCFILNDTWSNILFARIAPGKVSEAITHFENLWDRINPSNDFNVKFFEESLDTLYDNDKRLSQILNYFTALGIIIACLGLFGMASFVAEQRRKEIGLRKVLGASTKKIVFMQSREFVKLILAANIIAWPLSYFTMNKWLENFAYKTSVDINIFFIAGGVTLVISLCTVSYQTIKSAIANPIESLKNE